MEHWIFQANPDRFNIDKYIEDNTNIIWTVRQRHFLKAIQPGDEIFMWRAAGKKKGVSGIVARGVITDIPKEMPQDEASNKLWAEGTDLTIDWRVPITLKEKCVKPKSVIKRDWLEVDPVLSGIRILKMKNETNYRIGPSEAARLSTLVRNTGRDWNKAESLAGLWAYAQTLNKPVSKLPGSPISEVALTIGRAITGVYNKVMNFRAIDPTDPRSGFPAGAKVDSDIWEQFFDHDRDQIQVDRLGAEYSRLWGRKPGADVKTPTYTDFGDAPNDDPTELQKFAAHVRRGQPKFRENLLKAYDGKCSISDHGPKEVLEAVHIAPHARTGINELDNGLLLRCDLHSLFDADLLRIDPNDLSIAIDGSLKDTPYWEFHGKTIRTKVDGRYIGAKYLKQRWDRTT